MPPPLAYLLTWTTYGSHLHGDNKGSADRHQRNTPGTPRDSPNPRLKAREKAALKHPPVKLTEPRRKCIEQTIRDHADKRNWNIHALQIRSNHLHLVISADRPPETVMGQLKAWCTRKLREQDLVEPEINIWTRHGSTRYLNTPTSVAGAIRYTNESQGHQLRT